MPYRIFGPKGHLIVRRATWQRVKALLPALRRRFGNVRVQHIFVPPTEVQLRARILEFCRWGIQNEAQIHYAQFRPMERVKTPAELRSLPRSCDCSEFATDAYAYARAPDPNGADYNGTGFTGTMLAHCRHIPPAQAKPGDLVVFGPGSGHHVVVLLESGTVADPLVCSHGQESGPVAIRLSAEAAGQPIPVTYLTCL